MLDIDNEPKIDNRPLKFEVELNSYFLSVLYLCYKYTLPLDIMITFYEKYGKDSLLMFKLFACKRNITLNDKQLLDILTTCKKFYRQILTRNIVLYNYEQKFQDFITWLQGLIDNSIYDETITFKFNYDDLYEGLNK